MGIIYLAGPYTHPDPAIREARFLGATKAAAKLIERGLIVFSPLTMTHPLDKELASDGATLGSDYWVAFDEAFMEFCSEIIVLRADGWEASSGVRREIEFFKSRNRPVSYIDP